MWQEYEPTFCRCSLDKSKLKWLRHEELEFVAKQYFCRKTVLLSQNSTSVAKQYLCRKTVLLSQNSTSVAKQYFCRTTTRHLQTEILAVSTFFYIFFPFFFHFNLRLCFGLPLTLDFSRLLLGLYTNVCKLHTTIVVTEFYPITSISMA